MNHKKRTSALKKSATRSHYRNSGDPTATTCFFALRGFSKAGTNSTTTLPHIGFPSRNSADSHRRENEKTGHPLQNRCARIFTWLGILVLICSTSACRTVPRLAPVDVTEAGWQVQQGQAVWKPKKEAPEIAGDLLLATNEKLGRSVIQFTKTPIPFVIAQITTNSWQIEIPVQKKFYSGHGRPPARLSWFLLPGLLQGTPPPKGSVFERKEENWKLIKPDGETIEGFLEKQ
jgi:hypothetical protein